MYACGYRRGLWLDLSRQNWDQTGPRPVAWSAWYPASPRSSRMIPRMAWGLFDLGEVDPDQALAHGGPWPVVLLSHGTGGSAESLGWLARELACRGSVVLAAQHHGNTSLEPYRAEGFLCWWERARDLSGLLTEASGPHVFGAALDLQRVAAVGYSLGAHTVLSLGGAVTSMDLLQRWQDSVGAVERGPREFPDLAGRLPSLFESSAVFRASWSRQGDSNQDPRVRAVVAIAPPPPVRAFTHGSIQAMTVPVTLMAGGADLEAPLSVGAAWLQSLNPNFALHEVGGSVGHHSFLGPPSATGQRDQPELFADATEVARDEVHRRVLSLVDRACNAEARR